VGFSIYGGVRRESLDETRGMSGRHWEERLRRREGKDHPNWLPQGRQIKKMAQVETKAV